MKAKVEPLHGEPNSLCLAVVVHYETSVIPTAVWDGLTLSDGAGKTMVLKTLGVATENLRLNDPVRPWGSYRLTARYALRPANPADKLDPQKLVFSGCRSISVEIPFHLKDVPLSRGTGGHAIPKLEISK